MAVCRLLILAISLIPDTKDLLKEMVPVFWLEGIAITVIEKSWLTKGEAILKDLPND